MNQRENGFPSIGLEFKRLAQFYDKYLEKNGLHHVGSDLMMYHFKFKEFTQ
ncbi:hypothetical protein [Bacillus thuringiensis]|uniref:hypothetical protein n=1 Tax=Bacillus thuringiensis TaxID=1428 RepID=UPI001364B890|nr:hypothetical protein [Bacillus thuringiensis]NUW47218.1 hypothetical protein [Bacillus thuringiensis]